MITLPSGRKIGPGEPCFIIAEIGSNWTSLEDCLESIRQAKACGADAVKFQLYDFQSLYGVVKPDTYAQGTLLSDWLPKLKAEADKVGIEFMCSAFSPELVERVDPYVNIHKVASAECTHKSILEKLRDIGKPVILSTGAHGVEDINLALSILRQTCPVALMYCISGYPTRRTNPRAISDLQDAFPGIPIGLSDHSTEVYSTTWDTPATVVEKHVSFICADTPDSSHSLTSEEFKAMVDGMRQLPKWSGPSMEEKAMILRHNRRIIATRDVAPGDLLQENENFGIYRSLKDEAHAFHPFMIDEVNGKTAKRAIKAGDGIGPGDI